MSWASKVFFATVAKEYLVARDTEVKRLRGVEQQFEKMKRVCKAYEHMICPVCNLVVTEAPRYCVSCNVGLPCETWREEEHSNDDTAKKCINCDQDVCVYCFNDEMEECNECFTL